MDGSERALDIDKLWEHPAISNVLQGTNAEKSLFSVAIRLYNAEIDTVFATVASAMGWAMRLKAVCRTLFPEYPIAFRFVNGKEDWTISIEEVRDLQCECVSAGRPEQGFRLWPLIAALQYKHPHHERMIRGHSSAGVLGLAVEPPEARLLAPLIRNYAATRIGRYVVFDEREDTGTTVYRAENRLKVLLALNPAATPCDSIYLQGRHGDVVFDRAFFSPSGRRSSRNALVPYRASSAIEQLHERYAWGESFGGALRGVLDTLKVPISASARAAESIGPDSRESVCDTICLRMNDDLLRYGKYRTLPDINKMVTDHTVLDDGLQLAIDSLRYPELWGLTTEDRRELERSFACQISESAPHVKPILLDVICGALDREGVECCSTEMRALREQARNPELHRAGIVKIDERLAALEGNGWEYGCGRDRRTERQLLEELRRWLMAPKETLPA